MVTYKEAILYPVSIYLFKVNNKCTRKWFEICPKLTKKDTRTIFNSCCSGVFLFNFDHILFLASCSTVSYVNFELVRAYSNPLLSATIAPNLMPWVLKKNIFIRNGQKWHLFRGCKQTKHLCWYMLIIMQSLNIL